jgi:hypothetical protein
LAGTEDLRIPLTDEEDSVMDERFTLDLIWNFGQITMVIAFIPSPGVPRALAAFFARRWSKARYNQQS